MSPNPFYLFLTALTLFRLAYTGWVDLVADEAHFWIWSQNVNPLSPDHFGSHHPPMVAYFIAISSFLGDSERAIRFSAVMATSAVTLMIYHLALSIFKDHKIGFAAAIITNILPIFALGGLVITTDTPFIFFWAVMLYLAYKIVETKKAGYWYATGLVFGLALTSKFSAFLFPASFFLFLIFSANHRFWLARREPYIAFIIGLIVFSPVIVWNLANDGGSFQFHFGRAFSSQSMGPMERAGLFWGGQFGLYGGPLLLFIIAGSFGAGWMALKEKRDDYRYLFFMSAPLIVFFFLNSFRSKMEGNWSAGAYIAAIIATPGFTKYVIESVSAKTGKVIKGGYLASLGLSAIVIIYCHAYIIEPSLPMSKKVDIEKRFYGWDELGMEATIKLHGMKGDTFIMTDWYHTASLLHYYIPARPEAFLISPHERFDYFSPGAFLKGRDALYVAETDRLQLESVMKRFGRVEPAGSYKVIRKGKFIQEFLFFKCYNYTGVRLHS